MARDHRRRDVFENNDVALEVIYSPHPDLPGEGFLDYYISVGGFGLYMDPGQLADLYEMLHAMIEDMEENIGESNE